MRYSLNITTPAAAEPLTAAEAKLHCRVDSSVEDDLFDVYIESARRMVEAYTSRSLITKTYTMKIDTFPEGNGDICLPRTPLGSVLSITYVDVNGSTQTLSTDYYDVLSDSVSASVVLKPIKQWPETQFEKRHAVTVTFTAGYGATSASAPQSARSAMLLIVGNLYENREGSTEKAMATLPMGVTTLLDTISARVPV